MEQLRVAVPAVQLMSVRWRAQVDELVAAVPPALELACQPSSGAVRAGHAAVGLAATSLMGRMRDSAAKVAAANSGYAANETNSAAEFVAIIHRSGS